MKCEKCEKEHDGSYGSGRFCSVECARAYSSSKVDKNKTKIVQCIDCGVNLEVSLHASGKQCKCDDCRRDIKQNNIYCLNCEKRLSSKRNKYCDQKCQHEHLQILYIKDWKSGKKTGVSGRNGTSKRLRKYIIEKYDNKCSKCGWNEVNEYSGNTPLELEHIDGNWKNNKEENLTLLCPNCHSLTGTYKALNKGNGREYRYLLK
jgi:hypothetical protein